MIGPTALARIDQGRRPLVLDQRRARDHLAGRQGAALIARHRDRPRVAKEGAQLAGRSCGAGSGARAERELVAYELRGHAQVDALDALARGVAVELAMAALERAAQRLRGAGAIVHLELVVLPGI